MGKYWETEPWRAVQTNMRQIDMEDIDAGEYVRQLQSFDATVVLINTGGILASYDTALANHTRSDYLHGASLGELIDACHAAGIRVVARVDFSKVRRPVFERHPDWAYRTASGDIVDYNGDVHACVCGGFQQGYAFEILREILEKFPIDGLFINMGGFQTRDYSYREYGICHCQNCREKFRARTGLELPEKADMSDPVYRKYRVFQREVLRDYRRRLGDFVHSINPDVAIDGIDFDRQESNTEFLRPLPYFQYSASSNTRCLRGMDHPRVISNTTVDFIGYYYRHIAVSPAEQALRLWQNLGNFGNVDYYIIGRFDNHEDQSGFDKIRRVFHFAKAHEQEYMHIRACADALLLRAKKKPVSQEEMGWIRALTENHILFDEAEIETVKGDLSRYRAIILPGIESVSDEAAALLDKAAKAGSTIIASGFPSVYDGDYEPRDTAAPICLGMHRRGKPRHDMVSAMFKVKEADRALMPSFDTVSVMYFGTDYEENEYSPDTQKYLSLIPPHPYGPPERCYYTTVTDAPGFTVTPYGEGKGIYIPWACGMLYARDGFDNTARFLRDILCTAAGLVNRAPTLTPMVELTMGIAENGSHALACLINATGHFGTSYFDPLPVYNVQLSLPLEKAPSAVHCQSDGHTPVYRWQAGILELTLDSLDAYEGIVISF